MIPRNTGAFSRFASLIFLSIGLVGCASYTVPGGGADFHAMGLTERTRQQQTDVQIKDVLDKKPLAHFATSIAIARIQAPGYQSQTVQSFGRGAYSVVLTRDVETDDQFARLAQLPMVTGLAPINRLLLPNNLYDDKDLRTAAAALHADLLLVYTFDTNFYDEDLAAPLTVITLGISPNKHIKVVTTASAVLMDTRNGYIYGLSEATQQHQELANAWGDDAAVDRCRRDTETAAFEKLVSEFSKTWTGVVKQYANEATAAAK
jgi:hypothetical protein